MEERFFIHTVQLSDFPNSYFYYRVLNNLFHYQLRGVIRDRMRTFRLINRSFGKFGVYTTDPEIDEELLKRIYKVDFQEVQYPTVIIPEIEKPSYKISWNNLEARLISTGFDGTLFRIGDISFIERELYGKGARSPISISYAGSEEDYKLLWRIMVQESMYGRKRGYKFK